MSVIVIKDGHDREEKWRRDDYEWNQVIVVENQQYDQDILFSSYPTSHVLTHPQHRVKFPIRDKGLGTGCYGLVSSRHFLMTVSWCVEVIRHIRIISLLWLVWIHFSPNYKDEEVKLEIEDSHTLGGTGEVYSFGLRCFFDCMIDPESKGYLSEDYIFYHQWEQMVGKIYTDCMTTLGHIGNLCFFRKVQGIHISRCRWNERLNAKRSLWWN